MDYFINSQTHWGFCFDKGWNLKKISTVNDWMEKNFCFSYEVF